MRICREGGKHNLTVYFRAANSKDPFLGGYYTQG